MNNFKLWKRMIPIFLTSFIAWFYCMTFVPLGYIYNTFPGKDAQVMLIATLPGIIAMIGGFSVGVLMNLFSKKTLVNLSMIIMIIGGLMIRFLGSQNIIIAIVGSGLTGFGAGSVPAVNYASLAEISPENIKDKVCGWSDSLCAAGIMVSSLIGGFLSASGDWERAYSIYYMVIPILVLSVIWYPNEKTENKAIENSDEPKSHTEESILPKSIIATIVIKFFSALFYMAISLFASALIINELQIGTSALVGTAATFSSLVSIASAALVFLWLKFFKGYSTLIAQLVMGVSMLIASYSLSIPGIVAGWIIFSVGVNSNHCSYGTVVAMAPKGKAVGIASGLFVGATFLGEALCGYATPWMANLIFGSSLPSACIKTAGILTIIFGIISVLFFKKSYNIAFSREVVK